jgi:hypothetical protein
MGDYGFLVRHRTEIRHHNIAGDWVKITGKVVAKGVDDEGKPIVTVQQSAHNQHGDLSATSTGVVQLPSRK